MIYETANLNIKLFKMTRSKSSPRDLRQLENPIKEVNLYLKKTPNWASTGKTWVLLTNRQTD